MFTLINLCLDRLDSETERPRQQWLDRGRSETLNLEMKMQPQVTSARDACDSSDNKSKLAYL